MLRKDISPTVLHSAQINLCPENESSKSNDNKNSPLHQKSGFKERSEKRTDSVDKMNQKKVFNKTPEIVKVNEGYWVDKYQNEGLNKSLYLIKSHTPSSRSNIGNSNLLSKSKQELKLEKDCNAYKEPTDGFKYNHPLSCKSSTNNVLESKSIFAALIDSQFQRDSFCSTLNEQTSNKFHDVTNKQFEYQNTFDKGIYSKSYNKPVRKKRKLTEIFENLQLNNENKNSNTDKACKYESEIKPLSLNSGKITIAQTAKELNKSNNRLQDKNRELKSTVKSLCEKVGTLEKQLK